MTTKILTGVLVQKRGRHRSGNAVILFDPFTVVGDADGVELSQTGEGALTIALLHELEISPEPYIISELMASNLGGAATLIGDFPNLIISENASIPFIDFIKFGGMFPANVVIQLVVLAFLMWLFRNWP